MGIFRNPSLLGCLLLGSAAASVGAAGLHAQAIGRPAEASVSQADQELLGKASRAFHEIAETAMPAVVSINSVRRVDTPSLFGVNPHGAPGMPGMEDDEGASPLANPRDKAGSPKGHRMMGIGSGIIIRKDGLVLTNNHVVENAEKITVTLDEKHKSKAHIIGTDPKTDLAVIKLDGVKQEFPVISFGNSDQISAGDWAIAIGSPFGLNRSVSFGIVSAKGRGQMGILDIEDFIQTDAAINPGNSGGPLLNAKGELIGVNTAIFSESGGSMGIGFAIPSRIAKEVSDQIIQKGKVSRGYVGLTAQDLDNDLAKFFKTPVSEGALISEVIPDGPASRAALKAGDVVTKYDNQQVTDASSFKSLVGKTPAGSKIPVEIIRNGKSQSLTLAVQEQPGNRPVQQAGTLATKPAPDRKQPSFGLTVEDVPTEISNYLDLPSKQGTIVTRVNPDSPAFEAGIGPGDIILSADLNAVHGAREFNRVAKDLSNKDVAVLYVQRGPIERLFVPVKLKDSG